MTSRKIRLVVEAVVDGENPALCADACPCHTFDDDSERCCGAFDRILSEPPDEAQDEDGNLLTMRCPECLSAELSAEPPGGGGS